MTRAELGKQIFETSHLTGDFLLRSGQRSNQYFDKYRFESNPKLLVQIAKGLAELIPDDVDALAGLEMGGLPIATALSIESGLPCVFVRKEAKTYGTCQFAEGLEIKGKKLLVVEDVVTSGGQLILSTDDLRASGAIVTSSVCVILRQSEAVAKLADKDIDLKHLYSMQDLIEFGEK